MKFMLPQNFDRCVQQVWMHGGNANPHAFHLRDIFEVCKDSLEGDEKPMKKKKKKKGY